jgi:hypothetical protein
MIAGHVLERSSDNRLYSIIAYALPVHLLVIVKRSIHHKLNVEAISKMRPLLFNNIRKIIELFVEVGTTSGFGE